MTWTNRLPEDRLRSLVRSHAALRRQVRDSYLAEAAALLGIDSDYLAAEALARALGRYRTSRAYRLARHVGRDDGEPLDRLLFMALAFGPVPQTVRQLYRVLSQARMAMSERTPAHWSPADFP